MFSRYIMRSDIGLSHELQAVALSLYNQFLEDNDYMRIEEILALDNEIADLDNNAITVSVLNNNGVEIIALTNYVDIPLFQENHRNYFRNWLEEMAIKSGNRELELYVKVR